jgi:hypothetical protein
MLGAPKYTVNTTPASSSLRRETVSSGTSITFPFPQNEGENDTLACPTVPSTASSFCGYCVFVPLFVVFSFPSHGEPLSSPQPNGRSPTPLSLSLRRPPLSLSLDCPPLSPLAPPAAALSRRGLPRRCRTPRRWRRHRARRLPRAPSSPLTRPDPAHLLQPRAADSEAAAALLQGARGGAAAPLGRPH